MVPSQGSIEAVGPGQGQGALEARPRAAGPKIVGTCSGPVALALVPPAPYASSFVNDMPHFSRFAVCQSCASHFGSCFCLGKHTRLLEMPESSTFRFGNASNICFGKQTTHIFEMLRSSAFHFGIASDAFVEKPKGFWNPLGDPKVPKSPLGSPVLVVSCMWIDIVKGFIEVASN